MRRRARGAEAWPPPVLRATAAARPATAAATSAPAAASRRVGHRRDGRAGRDARISVARCDGSGGSDSVSASEATGASSRASAAAEGGLSSGLTDRQAVTAATSSGGASGTRAARSGAWKPSSAPSSASEPAVRAGSAREELVEHGTDGVDVRCGRDLLAACLLGGEVAGGAKHGAGEREPRSLVAGRDAEVAELEDAVRAEEEVLRLHVAVDETRSVGGGEPGAHLRAERRRLGRRQRPAPRDELGERLPFDVLHRDEGTAVVLADVEDAHDVRVREPRCQTCLSEEAPPQVLVPRKVFGEPLQRHGPLEFGVVSQIDRRHGAMAERTDELVASCDTRYGAHRSVVPLVAAWLVVTVSVVRLGGLRLRLLGLRLDTGVHVMRSASLFTPMRTGERRRYGSLSCDATTSSRRDFASCNAWQLVPGGRSGCDRRRLVLPALRQGPRHPVDRGSLRPIGTPAAGRHDHEESHRRDDPQHPRLCTHHPVQRSLAFAVREPLMSC